MKTNTEFASRLVELALKKGADQAEAYIKSAKNLSLEVKNQEIDAIESSLGFGYSLRVIQDRKLGFSYATSFSEMESVVNNAIASSRSADTDYYLDLPSNVMPETSGLKQLNGIEIFDREIADIKEGAAIKHVLAVEKASRDFDSRIKKIRKASGTFSSGEILIQNSKGIRASYPYTKCTAQVMTVAEENNESQMGWDFDGSRFLKDVSFESIGENAARRAVYLLGSKNITSVKASVILDSSVTAEFLGIFASSLSAESAQKGRSLLQNRIGQKVVSSRINFIDSGLIPRRLGTKPVDDEGVATSAKTLIKEGILQGYLHSSYTAKKDGIRSTGNAIREGFSSLPTADITNFYVEASSPRDVIPFKGLLNSLDKGLLITEAMGIHTVNPISGEFSIGVSGLWIEKGEIKFPVKEAAISGNILEFFEKIEATGDDLRFYGSIGAPSLLIGATDISA